MLRDVDKKTIARGTSPAVTDSFAIEYKVRPAPEKVTIRTFEAEFVSDTNGRKNYKKSDRQKDVTIPYYIDYYPKKSVRTAQPLANVAAYLLEPQSNDGLVTWNFFDRYLVPQWGMGYNPYPVYKILNNIDLKTTPVL
jgi:hypothetical protein